MCDDSTLADGDAAEAAANAAGSISRRNFGLIGAAALAAYGTDALAAGPALSEAMVSIATPDGTCDAFFVHPAKGKFPAIVMWPDIVGLRDAFKAMARRLAAQGYAVLAVNQYYRGGKAPVLNSFAEWRAPAGQEKLKPYVASITPDGTMRDGAAFVAWLDKQAAVNTKRGIGTAGYCMGGPFTVRMAAAAPARVKAAASLHGAGLVGDKPDSPTVLLAKTQAGFLFAIGKNDDARSPGDKDAIKAAAAAAKRPAEVEVYKGDHGWTVPDRPSYDEPEAERAWKRMSALFAKL
jgi:carboxymethylenebutenolidase